MEEQFAELVSSVLGDFLSRHAFHLVGSHNDGSGDTADIVFKSDQCKLRFYDSRRGGEVNCLVGQIDALNESDWTAKSNGWYCLRGLLEIGKGLSLDESQKLVGLPIADRREQLAQLRDLLNSGFEKALRKLREKVV